MWLSQTPGPIVVFDVETTGLFPSRHDRILEIAAVVIQTDGEIEREFVSLVNPARDVGPSSIHGLTSQDVLNAPQLSEIMALLLDTVQGTVAIAGHNVRFDRQFLEDEFSRAGLSFPNCYSLCTMELAWGGNLAECCRDFGLTLEDGEAHHALHDARAAARLLSCILADQPQTVRQLTKLPPIHWPPASRSMRLPITRDETRRRQAETPTYLQRLLSRVHGQASPPPTHGASMAYGALLDRALEDRRVDDVEADALLETAAKWGLSGEQICSVHNDYLNRLAVGAVADGTVTEAERRDLSTVMRLLGIEESTLDDMLREVALKLVDAPISMASAQVEEKELAGKRVCFTGELQCLWHGEAISRDQAEKLATNAGLCVVDSVTKKLDVLVVADPCTQSGKAKKARQYGIRVMHEPVFWKAIGVNVS